MKLTIILCTAALLSASATAQQHLEFTSPGLPPTQFDQHGQVLEDWGAFRVELTGEGFGEAQDLRVSPIQLDGIVPAAEARWRDGSVAATLTAFRAPVWPAGLDVVTLRLEELAGREVRGSLRIPLPEGARIGEATVRIGSRRVLILPDVPRTEQKLREWGHFDEAGALPGWAKPLSGYDPAFANIRAGLGGVPIVYRFAVEPKAERDVVLGFCESYWTSAGNRFMSCKVEGAAAVVVDPLARWGRHQPGGLALEGRDSNGDGWLEILILPGPSTPDRNPILNAIWLFEPTLEVEATQVITGRLNAAAERYVDVGGAPDQSLLPQGKLELPFVLQPKETKELTFLAACRGGSLPAPEEMDWTVVKLREAARKVWEDWKR